MQILDENKRKKIIAAAGKLFGKNDYHSVCLSEIAAEAKVGKGTLYVYFKSKEDLFSCVRIEGYTDMYRYLSKNIDTLSGDPLDNLHKIISETVKYCYRNKSVFKLLRAGTGRKMNPKIKETRKKVLELTRSVIESGVEKGILCDSKPAYTANYLLDVVRSGLTYSEGNLPQEELIEHIFSFFSRALQK